MSTPKIYCPSCGQLTNLEENYIDTTILRPGYFCNVTCKNCDTMWDIRIEFYEVERGAQPQQKRAGS